MTHSFALLRKPGRKISLEHSSHPCPKCKHQASVQLTRSEKRLIVLNKCISNSMRVRYECSKCNWRNEELPFDENDLISSSNDDPFGTRFSSGSSHEERSSVQYSSYKSKASSFDSNLY